MQKKPYLSIITFFLLMAAQAQNAGRQDSIASLIASRSFPSIFEAWTPAENLRREPGGPGTSLSTMETPEATMARHDLYFGLWSKLGLKLAGNQHYALLSPEFTPESIEAARRNRAALLAANPKMLILAELTYYSSGPALLPHDSPWWRSDPKFKGSEQRLDFSNPEFQDRLAALCAALTKTGVFDGFMLDWWHDDDEMGADRLALIKKIRTAAGEKAILLGNVNFRLPTHTASYLNGMYMEGFNPRVVSAWYPFWDKSLGKPAGPLAVLDRPDLSGAYTRQFEKGEVVFNPPSNNPVTVHFDQPRRSAASGTTGRSFTVAPGDGDLFLDTATR